MKTWITILAAIMMFTSCKGQKTERQQVGEQSSGIPAVRPATQANRFYTGDARELGEDVDSFLALHAKDRKYEHVAALIVPHAG